MKYERPEIKVEKFTFEPVMAEFVSSVDPVSGSPILEENDPYQELLDAFGNVLDLGR